ncbi:MAG: hypothetical protein RL748_2814 [Pseudomonadota bacterium]
MSGSMSFEFSFKPVQQPGELEQLPLHILLLDNFSGHRGKQALAERAFSGVDIDNFDQIMARHAPQLDLDLAGTQVRLQFRNLDDFHPDAIYRNVPMFAALRQQLQQDLLARTPASVAAPDVSASDNPFQALLGREATPAVLQANPFEAMIKQIVAPHLTHAAPALPAELPGLQDAACSLLMRAILQHPEFQALEAAWRGVHFLLTQLELDGDLRLFLLDASKHELAQDCAGHGAQLDRSVSYQMLAERWQRAANPVPWGMLVASYQFDTSSEDLALLAAMGAIARQINAPFLAGAASSIVGCSSYAEQADPRDWQVDGTQRTNWQALCQSSQAHWLGLVMQRQLLRLPYGPNTDPVDAFKFEEISGQPLPEQFLWGSGALAVAALIGQSFLEDGWDMEPGSVREIGDMPAYSYKWQGEAVLQPGAESALLERAADAGIAAGLMPLTGFKNRNAVRVLRIQSLAQTGLGGRW